MSNEKKDEVNQKRLVKNYLGKIAKQLLQLAGILLFVVICFTIGIAYSNNEKEPTCRQIDKPVVDLYPEKEPTIDKPVVYLYPEKNNTPVSVDIDYDETLTSVYPSFTQNSTWKVTADKNGTIHKNGKRYNYLFWEGENSKTDWDFNAGFCVKGKDTAKFLEDALGKLGLNSKEINDFIVYWLPQMENNPYNVISFQTDLYTAKAKLTTTPSADTTIRVMMAWYPSKDPVDIKPQKLSSPDRIGFTVVEWGGTKVVRKNN